jgi:hypothetical protein
MRYTKQVKNISEDGEVLDEKIKSYYLPFKDKKGYNYKYKSHQVKYYVETPLPKIKNKDGKLKEVDDRMLGRIFRISRCMQKESNLFVKVVRGTFQPMTRDDFQCLLKMHRTKFVPFWKTLLDSNIIRETTVYEKEYYCMNPLYFNSTMYLPLHLFITFQDEITRALKKDVKEWVVKRYLDWMNESVNNFSGGVEDVDSKEPTGDKDNAETE